MLQKPLYGRKKKFDLVMGFLCRRTKPALLFSFHMSVYESRGKTLMKRDSPAKQNAPVPLL